MMNLQNERSPSYRNIRMKTKQSPIEIKEKIRKSYREKVLSCRTLLHNSFRGLDIENGVRNELNEIIANINDDYHIEDEEKVLKEIREELVIEELEWWFEEYEKYQRELESSSSELEQVICPVCQKANFVQNNSTLRCPLCNIIIKTDMSMHDLRQAIFRNVETHGAMCNNEVQFSAIPDSSGTHIYLICDKCHDMLIIV